MLVARTRIVISWSMKQIFFFQSPTPVSSKNGITLTHDAKKAEEEHSNLLPGAQEQDSLQADSERGLVKLSSV